MTSGIRVETDAHLVSYRMSVSGSVASLTAAGTIYIGFTSVSRRGLTLGGQIEVKHGP